MKLSYNQLQKLRSGQQVWRVLFNVCVGYWMTPEEKAQTLPITLDDGRTVYFTASITRTLVMGKKQEVYLTSYSGDGRKFRLGTRMIVPKHLEYRDYRENGHVYGHFLGDLAGDGAFSQQRQAERFVQNVLAGQYADLVAREVDKFLLDELWDDRYTDAAYDDYADSSDEFFSGVGE